MDYSVSVLADYCTVVPLPAPTPRAPFTPPPSHGATRCTFFKKSFWRTHVLSGATGTPGLDFWWRLLWVFKARVGTALFAFLRRRMQYIFPRSRLLLHCPPHSFPTHRAPSPRCLPSIYRPGTVNSKSFIVVHQIMWEIQIRTRNYCSIRWCLMRS